MRAKTTLGDGLSILQSIAESDAFREMRERLRDGATRLADNDRVPRLIAGSAGILAALLADSGGEHDPDLDHTGASYEAERDDAPDRAGYEEGDVDDADEWVPESSATVRDLDDPTLLEERPDDEAVDPEEPSDDEERLLRFEIDHDELVQQPEVDRAPKPATSKKARAPRVSAAKKPAAKPAKKAPAKKAPAKAKAGAAKPAAKPKAPKAASKSAAGKASKPKAPNARKPARSATKLPAKTPRPRSKKSS